MQSEFGTEGAAEILDSADKIGADGGADEIAQGCIGYGGQSGYRSGCYRELAQDARAPCLVCAIA